MNMLASAIKFKSIIFLINIIIVFATSIIMASDSLIFPVYEGKTFYNDGKIKAIYEYINLNGQIWHGKYKKYYHKNGSINTKGDYFFNRRVGIWKYFNNTGQVIKEVFYGKNLDDTSTVHKNTNTIHKNSVNIQKALHEVYC